MSEPVSVYPVEIKRIDNRQIIVLWSDDLEQTLSSRQLRDRCPCATCRQPDEPVKEEGGLRVLSTAETLPLEIVAMRPVGNYAYHIDFSDGHNTGIFTFDLLRSFG